ncbi:TIGR01548 family HAD-type hydrolase [Leptodesmis sp.]|uniref:TIGR01548 family HAD-type hydrolase n=1 Tax=Leptodesmis sp. TaxID=3100501 RepID=UPI0040534E9E
MKRQSAIAVFDIDGVVRDVGNSYRRALADTVEYFTAGAYRPSQAEIDALKSEGIWNNDWEASQELVYRFFETQTAHGSALPTGEAAIRREQTGRGGVEIDYSKLVAFFQSRYRGPDPIHWTGYICHEPLLFQADYLERLTQAGILWGFFSGATRGSASYVLEKRLGLQDPVLIAMEDAPGKPDPTGLLATVDRLEQPADFNQTPVLYLGDTVADMYTVQQAREQQPQRSWIAVGVLPPHVQETPERSQMYAQTLKQAGADIVFSNAQELTPEKIWELVSTAP